MTKNLYIIGAGSHASVIIDCAITNKYKIKCLIDINSKNTKNEKKFGIPVNNNSFINNLKKNSNVFLAIGDNKVRTKYFKKYKNKFNFLNLISKSSQISINSKLGKGNYIGPNVIINGGSSIGNNCILNTSSIIEHDVNIGDNTHICPSVTIGGSTEINDNCFIGLGSNIIDKIKIGKNVKLGAGSLVLKNLKSNSIYYGTPLVKIY